MEKNFSTFDKTQVCETQIDQVETFHVFQKPSQTTNITEESTKKEEANSSMEKFCYLFFKSYCQKTNEIINSREFSEKYKIKSRRVYELMAILQGFSFVYKMKKAGHYMWVGTQSKECHFHFQQNRSVALKNVAGLLKLLLTKSRQGYSIKELNQKMRHCIQEKTKIQQCKSTINRRIYQCLKVMKIIGMVEKEDQNFKMIKNRPYKINEQTDFDLRKDNSDRKQKKTQEHGNQY